MKQWSLERFTLASAVAMTGCVTPTPPPTFSMSKYARAARPSSDAPSRVGGNLAVAHWSTDEGSSTIFPWVEGALSVSPSRNYDVAISVQPAKLNIEGNLGFSSSDSFRLGLLHGVGFGTIASDSDDVDSNTTLFLDATAGLMAQVWATDQTSLFFGGRYAYATSAGDNDGIQPTHYAGGALGVLVALKGGLVVSPEVLIANAWYDDDNDETEEILLIVPSLNVSATF